MQWPEKKSANRIAMHIGRCIGAVCIGEAVMSLQAPGFLHFVDKRALFTTRIVVNCCIMMFLYSSYAVINFASVSCMLLQSVCYMVGFDCYICYVKMLLVILYRHRRQWSSSCFDYKKIITFSNPYFLI